MSTSRLNCACGAVQLELTGQPLAQYYCHCDDCQSVHGAAYECALYPAEAVVVNGETSVFVLRIAARRKCSRCGTYLFAELPGHSVRGVNGALFAPGAFVPQFHMQCKFASEPIQDDLPHFQGLPPGWGGSRADL
jgi:hypothetical protein